MVKKTPLISVILSAYNAQNTVGQSIQSILNQTWSNFELIIFNDASRDGTQKIIESFNDKRIIKIINKKKSGLAQNLNNGISMAGGEYIARMDADDLSFPSRLEEQVNFLEKNRKIDLVGTWMITNLKRIIRYPVKPENIKASFLLNNPISHPTVVFRKESFTKNKLTYNVKFIRAQDYELWSRAKNSIEFANLPKPLYMYHLEISKLNKSIEYRNKIRFFLFGELGIKLQANEITILEKCTNIDKNLSIDDLNIYLKLMKSIIRQNNILLLYSYKSLREVIALQILIICLKDKYNLQKWLNFVKSNLFFYLPLALAKYILKSF